MSAFQCSPVLLVISVIVTMAITVPRQVDADSGGLPRDCHLNQVKANPRNAHSFYWCLPDGPVLMKCVDDLTFDPTAKKCITKQQLEKRHRDKLVNYQDIKNKLLNKKLPPFTSHPNSVLSSKDAPSQAPVEVQCPSAYHTGRDAVTVYQPSSKSCTEFYVCSNGKAEMFQCPDGLLFNPEMNVCDWERNVAGCKVSTKSETSPYSSSSISKSKRKPEPLRLVL